MRSLPPPAAPGEDNRLISIVVSTHERPALLDRCLAALSIQEGAGTFEVIVADDGSGPETRAVVDAWKARGGFPLRHQWEEHSGFRLARTRNRGILDARGGYLIFLDGDCVPLPGFVRAHRRSRRKGSFLAGSRYLLGREVLVSVPSRWAAGENPLRQVPRRERLRLVMRDLLDRAYRLSSLKDRPKPLGANLSLWRCDLEAVNGFDEKFQGWGHEDEDLGRRLSRLRIRKRFAPASARVIHLWHPPDPTFQGRAALSGNFERLRRGFFIGCCREGIRKRALTDLRIRIRGLPRIAGEFPRVQEEGEPVELELLGPDEKPGSFPAEVRIGIVPAGAGRRNFPGVHGVVEIQGDPNSDENVRRVLEALEEWL